MIVQVLFSQQSVTSHCQTVVGGKDDDRVVRLPCFLQSLQHTSYLYVYFADHAVIIGKLLLHLLTCSWGGY